jgi:lipid A 4'-phosphatase
MDRTLLALVVALLATLFLFALFPNLDLATAHFFYDRGGFLGANALDKAARWFFRVPPYVLMIGLAGLWALRRLGAEVPYAPTGRAVVFVVASMAIGPGLIVNLGMKDHLHRPRPVHVQAFGGEAPFKPWYEFDGACVKNCGFASGEAAQGFWMVAPALLVPPPWRGAAIAAALVYGAAASVLRLAFGGHFLSDVVVAALITLIVVFALRRILWPRGGP